MLLTARSSPFPRENHFKPGETTYGVGVNLHNMHSDLLICRQDPRTDSSRPGAWPT